jgi:hypothetical protein
VCAGRRRAAWVPGDRRLEFAVLLVEVLVAFVGEGFGGKAQAIGTGLRVWRRARTGSIGLFHRRGAMGAPHPGFVVEGAHLAAVDGHSKGPRSRKGSRALLRIRRRVMSANSCSWASGASCSAK